MTFGDAIQTVFRKYADFSGRASRPEFWWWTLFNVLVTSALNVLNTVPISQYSYLGTTLSSLWAIAVLVPNLAVAVRRLRDGGYSWANLFWLLLPVAGLIVLIVLLSQPSKETVPAAGPARA